MLSRRSALSGLVGLGVAAPAGATPASSSRFADDIDLLRRIYETLHPGLYRYQSPTRFAARCEAAKDGDGANPRDHYLRLSRLLAQVRCGHTYANFFNQTKAVSNTLFEPANKLPFHFIWLGDRMVVSANPRDVEGLAPGDEILAVDGVPAKAIQAGLLPFMRADGSNDDKRRVLLDVTGTERIESFDVFHPLVFPPRADRFSLLCRQIDTGRARTLAVEPIDLAARRAMAPATSDDSTPAYWSLSWPTPAVAVITMPGWALYDVKWNWKARLDGIFDQIAHRGAKGLVIDLRDNEGGLDCGNEIIARLIDSDMPLFADGERRVRFRSTPRDLNRYLDTWDRTFEHLGEGAVDIGNGFYRLKADGNDLKAIAPKGPRFRGGVIVLSGPRNSSATFQFIALMRRHGLARIYGQPTGGNRRGINGGSFFFVRLPGSGLEADLPLVGFFPNTAQPDAGLLPDRHIDPTAADLAMGSDRALHTAVADLS